MPSRPTESCGRVVRWLGPATLLALTPKCLICLLAYGGLGTALRLGGPEICGASADSPAPWDTWLVGLGVIAGIATLGVRAIGRHMDLDLKNQSSRGGTSTGVNLHRGHVWNRDT